MRILCNHLSAFINHSKKPLYLVLLIGLSLRVIVTLAAPGIMWPDSFDYYRGASAIASSFDFSKLPIYRTPGYPTFLALFLFWGHTPTIGILIVVVQHLLGLFSIYFIYKTTHKLFGAPSAFIAGLLSTSHTLLLYYETTIHTEVLFVFLLTALIYYFINILDLTNRPTFLKHLMLLGLLASLLTLVRPIGQLLLLTLLMLLLIKIRKIGPWLLACLSCLVPYFLVLMPWLFANYHTHHFFGLSKDLGINLFHRVIDVDEQAPIETTKYRHVRKAYLAAHKRKPVTYFDVLFYLQRKKYSPRTIDNLMAKVALERLKQSPEIYIRNTAWIFYKVFFKYRSRPHFCASEKGKYLCSNSTRMLQRPAFPQRPYADFRWAKRFVYQYFKHCRLPIGLLSFLALVGVGLIFIDKGTKKLAPTVCIFTILYFTGLTALLNREEDRFRLPVDGYIFMLAAYASTEILKRLGRRPDITRTQ